MLRDYVGMDIPKHTGRPLRTNYEGHGWAGAIFFYMHCTRMREGMHVESHVYSMKRRYTENATEARHSCSIKR
jgi:hypothetical protein